jgi:hypothetical protein
LETYLALWPPRDLVAPQILDVPPEFGHLENIFPEVKKTIDFPPDVTIFDA